MSWFYKNRWYIGSGLALAIISISYLFARKGGLLFGGVKANDWANENDYWRVDSTDLKTIGKSAGINLEQNKGLGYLLNDSDYKKALARPKVSWAVYDISKDTLLAKSNNANTNMYGASVSKAVVVGCAYFKHNGTLPTKDDIGKAIRLIVVSDNSTWNDLTKLAGGDEAVNNFSNKLGLNNMKPAKNKGNLINPIGMCLYWNYVLRNKFAGAESVFKITSSCQTHASRSRKYLPKTSFVGGKTGTWDGRYTHDSAWFNIGNRWYAISVFSDGSDSSETIALLFGGLFKQYCK
jgi:hypothetical protein